MRYESISATLIWSGDYQKLANWYREKLGLKTIEELSHPKDTGIGLRVGKSYLWIGRHPKVKGKNKDQFRHMFNISVKSVGAAYKELKSKGVEFIAEPFKAPTFNKYFTTFYDLDRNVIQFIGGK